MKLFKDFLFIFDEIEKRFLPQDYLLKNILRRVLHILESNPVGEYFKILEDAKACKISLTSPFHSVSYFFKRISVFLFKPVSLKKETSVKPSDYRPVDYLSDCSKGKFPHGVSLLPRNWSCVRDAKLISDARDYWPEYSSALLQKYPLIRLIYNSGLWFKFYRTLDIIRSGDRTHRDLFIIPPDWEFDYVCPQSMKREDFNVVEDAMRAKIMARMEARKLQKN